MEFENKLVIVLFFSWTEYLTFLSKKFCRTNQNVPSIVGSFFLGSYEVLFFAQKCTLILNVLFFYAFADSISWFLLYLFFDDEHVRNELYNILYVCFKFVRQEAVGTYYIPWPAKKKLLPKFLTKFVCPKQPKSVQPAQPTGQSCQKTNFKKHMVNININSYRYLWSEDEIQQYIVAFVLPGSCHLECHVLLE